MSMACGNIDGFLILCLHGSKPFKLIKVRKKNRTTKKVSESPINCITYTNSGVTIQNLGLPRYERFAFYDCHIDVLCSRSGKHSKMT